MRRHRNVKVVATLGPASSTYDMICQLFTAGADVFRLNMSHGEHEVHARCVADIRTLEKEFGRPTTILGDLQGPKLRIGSLTDNLVTLKTGQSFVLDRDDAPGTERLIVRITPPYAWIAGFVLLVAALFVLATRRFDRIEG